MKLFLTEVLMTHPKIKGGKMEPVGIFSKFTRAKEIVGKKVGLITELEVDQHYRKGIGVANHFHINDE